MADQGSFERLNKVDLYATRVFTLAVKFFGYREPISAATIRAELYPGLTDESFRRQFARDRNLLATLGIVIAEHDAGQSTQLWQIDEQASYVQGPVLSDEDARMLYVLCHDLTLDQAFALRDELRAALLKIAHLYQGSSLAPARSTDHHRALATLVEALASHRAVEVRYVDAQGVASERLLALFGTFGLRGHTYFVAGRISRADGLLPGTVRTYRLDRFERVTAATPPLTYDIPEDFCVEDYLHLPFQLGPVAGTATLVLDDASTREARQAAKHFGSMTFDRHWNVDFAHVNLLASWCVGEHVTALDPPELVEAIHTICLRAQMHSIYDPQIGEGLPSQRPAPATRPRGGDAATRVRQLITLASSLTTEGKAITAHQISSALGVTMDQARRLIMLVTMGSGESYDYLPLIIDDDYSEVFLMEGAQLSAPHVRLTRLETLALTAALSELGVPDDDPLATTLRSSYAAPTFSAADIRQLLNTSQDDDLSPLMQRCSQAIVDGRAIRFTYRALSDNRVSERLVEPQVLRRGEGGWYLDAYDFGRRDKRVFRVDRMSACELADPPEAAPRARATDQQMVTVRFDDQAYLNLFHWEALEMVDQRDGSTFARIPDYGGSWLPRHLAACAGTVRVDDEGLAARMRAEVRALLG